MKIVKTKLSGLLGVLLAIVLLLGLPINPVMAANGNAETELFAVVNLDGTLARGFGAVSSQRLSTGAYEVIFNRNVRNCAYVATVGLAGSSGATEPAAVSVVGRYNNVNGVYVATSGFSLGTQKDEPFHLIVQCPHTVRRGITPVTHSQLSRQLSDKNLISYWVDGSTAANDVYDDANVVMVNLGYFSTDGTAKFAPMVGDSSMHELINDWKIQDKTVLLSMGGTLLNAPDDAVNPQDWGFFFDNPSDGHLENFVNSLPDLLADWEFDGLDLDVEGKTLVNSTDAIAFNNDFAAAVRDVLSDKIVALTVPAQSVIVSSEVPYIGTKWVPGSAAYNTLVPMSQQPTFDANFDLIQIMMYDMDGDPDRTYHVSNLSCDRDSVEYRAQTIYEYTHPHEFSFQDWVTENCSGSDCVESGTNDAQWNQFDGIDPSKIVMGVIAADGPNQGYLSPEDISSDIIKDENVQNGMVWESHADANENYAISIAVKEVIDASSP
ncbi:MAG: glycoside hydrolase family 18 protein [Cyanobacteria bacterium SBLK]|nr:glycoside hydrolase family 18 protein [Cyanobacteria bacterium SBLK]